MKRNSINTLWPVAALAALAVFSCNVQEMDSSIDEGVAAGDGSVYHVVIEQPADPATRTFLGEDNKVLWTGGDTLAVANKNTNFSKYKFTGATGDKGGDIVRITFARKGKSTDYVVAYYPYPGLKTVGQDRSIVVDLPSVQAYASNSFGLKANPMVALNPDRSSQAFVLERSIDSYIYFSDTSSETRFYGFPLRPVK